MDFKGLVCAYRPEKRDVCVSAKYLDARLLFSAQNPEPNTESAWGNPDCEHEESLVGENTSKLIAALTLGEYGLEHAAKEHFSGIGGMRSLRTFCGSPGVEWGFSPCI